MSDLEDPDAQSAGSRHDERETSASVVSLPEPTAWPMTLALGIMLAASGFVTNYAFSAVGIVLFAFALAGWIHQMLPGAGEEEVPLRPPDQRARAIRPDVRQVAAERLGVSRHRVRYPEMTHPYSSGITGGIFGGIAMAAIALLYGIVSGHGIWYPVNLLGGMLLPGATQMTAAQLEQFSLGMLVLGLLIHGVTSMCVGLFFALILPMLPAPADVPLRPPRRKRPVAGAGRAYPQPVGAGLVRRERPR